MNKLTIFFLIILSNLVTNVQAAEEGYETPEEEVYQTPAERRKIRKQEMREQAQYVVSEYNRVSIIEDLPNKLTELKRLKRKADNAEGFLSRNQMYGINELETVQKFQKFIGQDIDGMRKSVMDIDTEEMDISDSD